MTKDVSGDPDVLRIMNGDAGGGAVAEQVGIDRLAECRFRMVLNLAVNGATAQIGAEARDPQTIRPAALQ